MMFNLPLPGGTTGHAVGMGMAAIVLGPWVAIAAISTALLIQALLFGDGGITAFGANCFNMAIVGSLVAFLVYRVVSGNAALTSRRRVLAAGLAGYCGINMAALCAAIEFGVQPILFRDAAGTPLYAPYPLHIAIPAMMLGHLTFAGLAELVLSAGVVAYLQRSDPGLLRATAPDAADDGQPPARAPKTSFGWPSSRKLWAAVGVFLVLTPLGILAAGSAWGEWRARDFKDPATRQAIAAVSKGQVPPAHVPAGLERIASLWTAPFSNYAPAFIRSPQFGYFVSAAFGVGAIVLVMSFIGWLNRKRRPGSRVRQSFLEKSTAQLLRISERALFAEEIARADGLLQPLDPRVKLAGLGALLISAIAVHRLWLVTALLLLSGLIALASRIPLRILVGRVWLGVFLFTGIVALPAIFLTPGASAARIPVLELSITRPGLTTAAFLLLRAATAATLAVTLVLTTPWNRLLRALRLFGLPASLVVVVQMTYRYIFVFLRTAHELFESRRARLLGPLAATEARSAASAIAVVLLDKSFSLSTEVHLAMEARGFRGEVRLLDDLAMTRTEWLQLGILISVATLVIWLGR